MLSDVLTCPYCNTPAAPPAGARPGQRISCSRCGESFPYRGSGESTPVTASPMPAPPPPPIAAPRRFSNGEIGRFVLGVMVVMAVIGLAYALSTQGIRREYDIHLPKTKAISIPVYLMIPLVLFVVGLIGAWFWGWNRRERSDTTAPPARRIWGLMGLSALVLVVVELALVVMQARTPRPAELESLPPIHAVPPAELAALGYLPQDTDLIMAVHVAELLDDPIGSTMIEHLGNESINLQSVEKWSGLKVADIDHVVLGAPLDLDLPVNFTLVVRARRAIDQGKVREKLKAKPQKELDGRTVYPFVMQTDLPIFRELDANLWFADEHTLVVAKRFADGPDHVVPTAPRTGLDHLRPPLRHLIAERMGSSTCAWVAGRLPDHDTLFPLLQLVLNRPENESVRKLKTFGVWVTTDHEGATMRGAFECADEDGARALKAYLVPANRKGIKEWLMTPDAGPMERAFAGSMTINQDGTWVTLTAEAGAASIRREK